MMIRIFIFLILAMAVRSESPFCAYEKEQCDAKVAAIQSECDAKAEEIGMLQKRIDYLETTIESMSEALEITTIGRQMSKDPHADRTLPTTTVADEIERGPVTDSCKTSRTGGCFWTEVRLIYSTTFTDAEEICEDHDSVVAVIPDEETYNAVVENARLKTPPSLRRYAIWTGMKVTNPATGEVEPQNAFYKWWPGSPRSDSHFTHVLIHINKHLTDRNPVNHGMYKISPDTGREGVVCWKPRLQ